VASFSVCPLSLTTKDPAFLHSASLQPDKRPREEIHMPIPLPFLSLTKGRFSYQLFLLRPARPGLPGRGDVVPSSASGAFKPSSLNRV
jgi:hypothetical protein